MNIIFKIKDKTKREICLSKERWSHIRKKHPEIDNPELIKETLENPDKIRAYSLDETIHYYYKYFKNKTKYLLVIVKYLNSKGFVITAYFERHVK